MKNEFEDVEMLRREILDLGFIRFSIWENIYTINDKIEEKNLTNVWIIVDKIVQIQKG